MDLKFARQHEAGYTSASQKIRVLSEYWVRDHVYCINCGKEQLEKYSNNISVADFHCLSCQEQYELKSSKSAFGAKVADGCYRTMLERLSGQNNPNLMLLNYDRAALRVTALFVVPKHFFIPGIIEQRRPLKPTARRAGWVGCNILINALPQSGRLFLVKDGAIRPKADVLAGWRQTMFLREQCDPASRRWLLTVIKCIEELRRRHFSLRDIYAFEDRLRLIYPDNRHIRAKIRQQLQVLRDHGYLRFKARGSYELMTP